MGYQNIRQMSSRSQASVMFVFLLFVERKSAFPLTDVDHLLIYIYDMIFIDTSSLFIYFPKYRNIRSIKTFQDVVCLRQPSFPQNIEAPHYWTFVREWEITTHNGSIMRQAFPFYTLSRAPISLCVFNAQNSRHAMHGYSYLLSRGNWCMASCSDSQSAARYFT